MDSEPHSPANPLPVSLSGGVRVAIKTIAVITVLAALYFSQSFALPIVMAIVLALTFSPLVRAGQRVHIPAPLSAAVLVISFGTALVIGTLSLATPFANLVRDAPNIGQQLEHKLKALREPVESINNAEKEVEKLTGSEQEAGSQKVVIKQPGLIARAADDVLLLLAAAILVLVLSYFILTSRDMFYRKIVHALPKLSEKKKALRVANEIERDVSHYLLTVSFINTGLGFAIGAALWAIDFPNPVLWGVLAATLNFLPYLGSIIGIAATTGVAIISFDSLGAAFLAPSVYLLLTVIEGQFVTPLVLGRRFALNIVVIFVSIAFWGFLWGPLGVFVAMPILIVMKVLCDRVDSLGFLGEFLSGEDPFASEEGATAQAEADPAMRS